jgi:polyisoprenoid-binding protein YceI
MKKIIFTTTFICALFFVNIAVSAQNTTSVNFKIKNIGIYVDGSFNEVVITSNLDTNNLDASFINAVVEINSINTSNKKRNKHLLETDYFEETNYKQLKLESSKIERISANNYKLTGRLTIKKTTKTIVIPLIISENESSLTFTANFDLNRRDYGVGGSSWVMSNTVKIMVKHTIEK